jgi:hypothetical protein
MTCACSDIDHAVYNNYLIYVCQSLALTEEELLIRKAHCESSLKISAQHLTDLSAEQQTEQGVPASASYTLKRSSDKITNVFSARLYTQFEDQTDISIN